jgi:TfoX/Sxy family transcriptional regulator of competence genes
MATRADTVQYIADQAGLGRRLEFRRMFGEYALYVDGKVTALVCDDQLFLKPTPEGRRFLGAVTEAPPYPGAKNFFLLAEELEDPERLAQALAVTAAALPAPKPKTQAKSKVKSKAKSQTKAQPAKRKAAKKQLSSRHR